MTVISSSTPTARIWEPLFRGLQTMTVTVLVTRATRLWPVMHREAVF